MPENSFSKAVQLISARRDGLCGRLGALLTTIQLSEMLHIPYKFLWPTAYDPDRAFHVVNEAHEILEEHYLEKHLFQGRFEKEKYFPLMDPTENRVWEEYAYAGEKREIAVYRWSSSLPVARSTKVPDGAECFRKIGFSNEVLRMFSDLEKLNLMSVVGIHLRRGDILYGENRFNIYNDRYVPLAIVEKILKHLEKNSIEALLFSDDDLVLDYLESRYKVQRAENLIDSSAHSPIHKALSDIVLMSKCGQLLARGSAFSTLAGRIGAVRLVDINQYFGNLCSENVVREEGLRDDTDHPALQKAKDAFFLSENNSWDETQKLADAERALALDPENYTYIRTTAGLLAKLKMFKRLESVLKEGAAVCFSQNGFDTTEYLPANRFFDPEYELEQYNDSKVTLKCPDILAYESDLYERCNQLGKSLEAARAACEMAPSRTLLVVRLAHLLLRSSEFEEARNILGNNLEKLSTLAVGNVLLARLEEEGRNWGRCAAYMENAFELSGEKFEYAARSAFMFQKAGNEGDADRMLGKALGHGAHLPTVQYWYSRLAEFKGDMKVAVNAMSKAHTIRPDKTHYALRLSRLQGKQGMKSKVKANLKKFLIR